MKQLALALSSRPEPTFGSFVVGRNAELVAMLRAVAAGTTQDRFVYVWGVPGSGRTHLMSAATTAAAEAGRTMHLLRSPVEAAAIDAFGAQSHIAMDDVDRLDAEAQVALFALYNRIRDGGVGVMLTAGSAAPAGLGVRPDLATRLGWGLVYEVHALSDDEKAQAMRSHASARGFRLTPEVEEYVLRHAPRDLHTLLALIERIDRYSLEERRPVTVPLAREVLQQMQ